MSSSTNNQQPFPRFHAVATRLNILPPEVVHQILDDLQVIKILEILCIYSHPSIDFAVQSHIHLKPLLCYSPESFDQIKSTFTLYYEVITAKRYPEHPQISELERDARTLVQTWQREHKDNLLSLIRIALLKNLEAFAPWIKTLNEVTTSPIPSRDLWDLNDTPSMRLIWKTIHAAEINLNKIKSNQLHRLADLIQKYPSLLICSTAPSQEPHPNVDHRVFTIGRVANLMLNPQFHSGKFIAKRYFSAERLPIMPYDRSLRVLLRIFKKFPLEAEKNILTGRPMKPLRYDWPVDVRKDWDTVIRGMAYLYTTRVPYPSAEDLIREELEVKDIKPFTVPKPPLRTLWTPYSDWTKRQTGPFRQPCLMGTGPKDMANRDPVKPFDEREMEWLEAYLRVCRFIRELGSVMWSNEISLKDFWITHAES